MRDFHCKYYPCHDMKDLQCNYCMCPLYPCNNEKLGKNIQPSGVWDCSSCTLVHTKEFVKTFDEKPKGCHDVDEFYP